MIRSQGSQVRLLTGFVCVRGDVDGDKGVISVSHVEHALAKTNDSIRQWLHHLRKREWWNVPV